MIAKVPTDRQTIMCILDAAFKQIKREFGLASGTLANNYEAYAKLTYALETTLRLWRALDENYDAGDDIITEIHPR